MTDLIDTTEMYLRTVFELEEEGVPPLRARIAERLGHSGPTVSQTVARMERDGLLYLTPDRRIVLTEEGSAQAMRVMRKHRLAERFLVDVIGLPWSQAHDEACRWEHVMSEAVEARVVGLVSDAVRTPFGTPIPGLDELGAPAAEAFLAGVMKLSEALEKADEDQLSVKVVRLGEAVQAPTEQLELLWEAGITPGVQAKVSVLPEGLELRGSRAAVVLPTVMAEHVFIATL